MATHIQLKLCTCLSSSPDEWCALHPHAVMYVPCGRPAVMYLVAGLALFPAMQIIPAIEVGWARGTVLLWRMIRVTPPCCEMRLIRCEGSPVGAGHHNVTLIVSWPWWWCASSKYPCESGPVGAGYHFEPPAKVALLLLGIIATGLFYNEFT